jgi:NADH-quinone oxidoreductase subunit C
METLSEIKVRLGAAVPGILCELVRNEGLSGQDSLLVDPAHGLMAARFLRDDPRLKLDYLSNMTAVDWPDRLIREKVRTTRMIEGVEREIEETSERTREGYLEAVYHLYSVALRQGPVILRLRTRDRGAQNQLPSLTPIWRGAELQEREAFDLFGIEFSGHPDLRRILMWDGFKDHPMRKDYVEPDDYDYEPTPHDEVLKKVKAREALAPGAQRSPEETGD